MSDVQSEFWDWSRYPLTPDPGRCAPICTTWRQYLIAMHGGQDLGCYARRPIVGGSAPSAHASGAAVDWRYQDPGMGRAAMLDVVMPWLIDNSRALGIQAIHDYVGCRIWRPPGTSGRPTQPSPECGWRQQTPGSQMGQPWALWLHLECLNTRWSDTRTVGEMLPGPPDPIPEDPAMYLADLGAGRIVIVGSAVRPVSADELAVAVNTLPMFTPAAGSTWWAWLDSAEREYTARAGPR